MSADSDPAIVGQIASMPILTADEVHRLPLHRRKQILEREQFLAGIKTQAGIAADAIDRAMQQARREGEKARQRKEETARIVADIIALPITPDPDGPENYRRLEEALRQDRKTPREHVDRQSTDMARASLRVVEDEEA